MYIPIQAILSKVSRDTPFRVDETEMIEWAGEALEFIGAVGAYENVVLFTEVCNYQIAIPQGLKKITQVARNVCWKKEEPESACPAVTVEPDGEEPVTPVIIDCNGQPMQPYSLRYYTPFYTIEDFFPTFEGSQIFNACYRPLRIATGTYFGTTGQQNQEEIYPDGLLEFRVESPYIRFSFQDGFVALAYTRTKLDESGLPMIPDMQSYIEAITRYITYKVSYRRFLQGDMNPNVFKSIEQDWHWYCQQAKNEMMMHKGISEHENSLHQRTRLLPNIYSFNTFFGRIANPYDANFKRYDRT